MKDALGNDLVLGDTVMYLRDRGLQKAKVVETRTRSYTINIYNRVAGKHEPTPVVSDYVTVERPGWNEKYNVRVILRTPGNVVKVPA
jgi:hypothetical protein